MNTRLSRENLVAYLHESVSSTAFNHFAEAPIYDSARRRLPRQKVTRYFFKLLGLNCAPVPLKRMGTCGYPDFFGCFHVGHYTGFVSSMHAAVYRLRERGVRLPRLKELSGELRLTPHQVGTNDPQALMAELVLEDGGAALPTASVGSIAVRWLVSRS